MPPFLAAMPRTGAPVLSWLLVAITVVAEQMSARRGYMAEMRKEADSLGVVEVPANKLWGAQTQRSLEHFSIGRDCSTMSVTV